MKYLLFALALTLQAAEPYPGQSEHREPPEGWQCKPQNYTLTVPVDHACNCERTCDPETHQVVEDKQCTVYCHMDHCACVVANMKDCQH